MTSKTPSGTRKQHESTKVRMYKTGKLFFFLLFSSDGLTQYCMNLLGGLCTKQQHIASNSRTMASSLGCNFQSDQSTWALNDHLAIIQNYYSRSLSQNTVVYVPCRHGKWAWDQWNCICFVLSTGWDTWNNCGRSLSWTYLNEWMNEWMSEWVSEWSIIHALWVPRSMVTRGRFVIPPEKGWPGVWTDAWVSDSSANSANVANTWVNHPYMLPVRTDFYCWVLANLSWGMHLLLKNDINK